MKAWIEVEFPEYFKPHEDIDYYKCDGCSFMDKSDEYWGCNITQTDVGECPIYKYFTKENH